MPPLAQDLPERPSDDHLVLTADKVILEQNGLSNLAGDVHLSQGDAQFLARALSYSSEDRHVRINAESLFRNHLFVIKSERADFDLNNETGEFLHTQFLLTQTAAHGDADDILLSRLGTADLKQVSYTTCAPENEAWQLRASEIHLDHDTGRGSARNATLRFFHVPVFWTPYLQFPIDGQRHTGLLFPLIGNSNTTGLDIRQPVYFNLAPNYDAQLIARYMSKRGAQLDGDFRYLLQQSRGHLRYEYLNRDHETNERRTYFEFDHVGLLSKRLGLDVQYAEVSDPAYFEDLGGRLDVTSISYLDRYARLTYQAPAAYRIQALVEDFQTINTSVAPVDKPYKRLPELNVNALTRNAWHDLRAGFDGEYVNFQRDDAVQGQRVNAQPYVRYFVDRTAWYVNSQADFQYTRYQLTSGTAPGADASPQRELPIFSAEGGLRFDRLTDAGNLQTLEPRLLYLYVPFRNQDQLPVFDSGEPDFDFVQLFARNRFVGEDRVADANHLAAAFTTRLFDTTSGLVRFTGSLGQIYRFQAPRVGLPGSQTPDEGVTDFIASFDYHLSQKWSAGAATQWSPDTNEFVRTGAALRYRSGDTTYDLGYRFRLGILQQIDTSLRLPLFDTWRFAGRLRYSIRDREALESLAGVEYDSCCWSVQVSWRRFIANSSGAFSNGVYMQLQLKGLTRIGSDYDSFLPQAH